MKKITLSLLSLFSAFVLFAGSPAQSSIHDSKEALAEHALRAIINNDIDAFFEVLPPDVIRIMVARSGSIEQAKAEIMGDLDQVKTQAFLNDPEQRARDVRRFIESGKINFIRLDGKWYLFSGSMYDIHSSRETLVEYFYMGLAGNDAEVFLQCLAPEKIRQGIALYGSEAGLKVVMMLAFRDKRAEFGDLLQIMLQAPLIRTNFIQAMVDDFSEKNELIQVDGKWYINMSVTDSDLGESKENVAEFASWAAINRDAKAALTVMSPHSLQQGIELFGSREALETAMQEFFDVTPAESLERMRVVLNDPEAKRRFITSMTEEDDDWVQIDGKWYINDNFMVVMKIRIIARLVDAAAARNVNAAWELLSGGCKDRMLRKYGSEARAKNALRSYLRRIVSETRLSVAQRRNYIVSLEEQFDRADDKGQKVLTKVGDKYYLDINF